jgi:nicotinamide-nucleotide amidase
VNIEIITIGREILDGRVIDTNSAFFGQQLTKVGHVPRHFQRVDDIAADIHDAFRLAATRARYVLVSGGLGPTSDDITAEVFAKFLNRPLADHPEAREAVRQAFARIQRPIHDTQWKQARLPEGVSILPNPHGTAPGFTLSCDGVTWFFMPGVPREMYPMFLDHVLPQIPPDAHFQKWMWMTHFTSEGELQHRLGDIIASLPAELSFFYRTRFPENHLGLSGSCPTPELKKSFAETVDRVSERLGADVYSEDELLTLERSVGTLAESQGVFLVSVESCTGGLVAHRLTDMAGASKSYWGSFVTYDNEAKESLAESVGLGEPMRQALEKHGAVSEETAAVMARAGAQQFLQKRPAAKVLAVSTTGIAGPDGGSAEKPVGLCFLAISDGKALLASEKFQARPGLARDQLKLLFSQKALDLLRLSLKA